MVLRRNLVLLELLLLCRKGVISTLLLWRYFILVLEVWLWCVLAYDRVLWVYPAWGLLTLEYVSVYFLSNLVFNHDLFSTFLPSYLSACFLAFHSHNIKTFCYSSVDPCVSILCSLYFHLFIRLCNFLHNFQFTYYLFCPL